MRVSLLLGVFIVISKIAPSFSGSFEVDICATSSSSSSYFDTTSLSCISCGSLASARIPDNSSLNVFEFPSQCTCRAGYTAVPSPCDLTLSVGCAVDTCVSCAAQGLASSRDKTTCLACGPNTIGLDTSSKECECPAGYVLTETSASGFPLGFKDCIPCPNGTHVFLQGVTTSGVVWPGDPYTCASCNPSDPNTILSPSGECSCAAGYTIAGIASLSAHTNNNGIQQKIQCLPQSAVDAVLSRYPAIPASTVNFYSVQTSATGAATGVTRGIVSAYHLHTYTSAVIGCRGYKPGSDNKACQALANLCVLQMYEATSTVCSLYLAMADVRGSGVNTIATWPVGLPLLMWRMEYAAALADTALARQMEYKKGTVENAARHLAFYLAKFSLDGTFLGMERVRNQFAYCLGTGGGGDYSSLSSAPAPAPDPVWGAFGHGFSDTYTCDVRAIASVSASPLFYDLYVRDISLDAEAADMFEAPGLTSPPLGLHPVPVRIVNFRTSSGIRPNANNAWEEEVDDYLTSRFVLFDAASGVRTPGGLPEVVRYASRIVLYIGSQVGNNDRIAPPVLTIEYHERPVSAVMAGGALPTPMAFDTLTFTVEYASDYSKYTNNIVALGASLGVIVGLWASLRITAWIRMNARSQLEATLNFTHVLRWLLFVATTFAFAFFWYLVVVTGWWLAYFKLQDSVYSLLPVNRPVYTDNAYKSFATGLWVVWIAYVIRLGAIMYKQVTSDIFFIDWEKSRGALFRMGQDVEAARIAAMMNGGNGAGAGSGGGGGPTSLTTSTGIGGGGGTAPASAGGHSFAPVSAWRSIFAANEWAELSVQRRTYVPLTLFVLAALLEGGKLKYVATPQPYVTDLTPGEINPALQFANNVFWYLVIVCIQLVFMMFIGERYIAENPTTRFVDLLTVMKVSLLVMDEKYHGFYIHGNAPHEHADGTMQEIANHLFEEAAAARVGRGLAGCPDPSCQTFELHVPTLWRDQYDRIFRRLLDQESAAVSLVANNAMMGGGGGGGGGGNNNNTVGGRIPGGMPPGLGGSLVLRARERTRRLAAAQAALSNFMKGFIEETDPDYKRVWRDRTLLQAAFDVPPDMLSELSSGMMVGGGAAGMAGSTASSKLTYTYVDHLYRFERMIFRGIELDLLIFEILLFCLVDYSVVSPAIAAVVTYVISLVISTVRLWAGNRNVAYKTLVDERFLL